MLDLLGMHLYPDVSLCIFFLFMFVEEFKTVLNITMRTDCGSRRYAVCFPNSAAATLHFARVKLAEN
jgi:hypothetical protein